MFRIDKSSVEYLDFNKNIVVVSKSAEESIRSAIKAAEKAAENAAEKAEEKAKKIISNAIALSEQIKKDAFDKGYNEGMQQAQKAGEEMLELNRREFSGFLSDMRKSCEEKIAQVENSVLELSCAIAEKIVNITLEKNDIVFVGLIKKAVRQLGACEKFTIRVGQREYDRYFGEGCQWLMDELDSAPFKVIRDSEIKDGGCVIESEDGTIDASADTQLEKAAKLLGIG